jgi:hypothetical protein
MINNFEDIQKVATKTAAELGLVCGDLHPCCFPRSDPNIFSRYFTSQCVKKNPA